jgi:hypothetical protein
MAREQKRSRFAHASVVTNDDLVSFVRSHRYSAGFLPFLSDEQVTAIREAKFKSVQRHLAEKNAPNLARATPARKQKKKEAEPIIRQKCETIRADHPGMWMPASHIVKYYIDEINEELKKVGKSYRAATLVRIIGKVAPLHSK